MVAFHLIVLRSKGLFSGSITGRRLKPPIFNPRKPLRKKHGTIVGVAGLDPELLFPTDQTFRPPFELGPKTPNRRPV